MFAILGTVAVIIAIVVYVRRNNTPEHAKAVGAKVAQAQDLGVRGVKRAKVEAGVTKDAGKTAFKVFMEELKAESARIKAQNSGAVSEDTREEEVA
jgi:hypothetical protein